MDKIKIDKISTSLINNIQDTTFKAVQGELENKVQFFIGTVVNVDENVGRAKVRYLSVDSSTIYSGDGETGYTDIEAAIKTSEKILINDIVIVFYFRNLTNSFIFGKMTNNYEVRDMFQNDFVSKTGNETIFGNKTFNGTIIANEGITTTGLNTRLITGMREIDVADWNLAQDSSGNLTFTYIGE